jgi:hypothetical protein
MTAPYPCPALTAWRRELTSGTRKRSTHDVLFWAAAAEQSGLYALRDGLHDAAARDFKRAARLLHVATRKRLHLPTAERCGTCKSGTVATTDGRVVALQCLACGCLDEARGKRAREILAAARQGAAA